MPVHFNLGLLILSPRKQQVSLVTVLVPNSRNVASVRTPLQHGQGGGGDPALLFKVTDSMFLGQVKRGQEERGFWSIRERGAGPEATEKAVHSAWCLHTSPDGTAGWGLSCLAFSGPTPALVPIAQLCHPQPHKILAFVFLPALANNFRLLYPLPSSFAPLFPLREANSTGVFHCTLITLDKELSDQNANTGISFPSHVGLTKAGVLPCRLSHSHFLSCNAIQMPSVLYEAIVYNRPVGTFHLTSVSWILSGICFQVRLAGHCF